MVSRKVPGDQSRTLLLPAPLGMVDLRSPPGRLWRRLHPRLWWSPRRCPAAPSAAPTLTSGPSADGIIARFPELTACPEENGCYIYVVRPGDNFVSIVNYYEVAYAAVLRMNPSLVDPAHLRPGDEIRIPTPRRN